MRVKVCSSPTTVGQSAAEDGADKIRAAIRDRGEATIIVATGASQFETLASLVRLPDIDWSLVTGFHLDEYLGLAETHRASFRGYLKQRFVDLVPIGLFHYVNGNNEAAVECERLSRLIADRRVDVAFIGIGENGHLAFNDPPADFETEQPYITVNLDVACRRQQHGEGWFDRLDDVPQRAISMSISQIIKSQHIVCSVPDERKAIAVQATLTQQVTPQVPASILQTHGSTALYLDPQSAGLIDVNKLC